MVIDNSGLHFALELIHIENKNPLTHLGIKFFPSLILPFIGLIYSCLLCFCCNSCSQSILLRKGCIISRPNANSPSPCYKVVFTLDCCILSTIALDWGFPTIVGTNLILFILNIRVKAGPMNSFPLSWRYISGAGYWLSQLSSNAFATSFYAAFYRCYFM